MVVIQICGCCGSGTYRSNKLTDIPQELVSAPGLIQLALGGNPITHLSEDLDWSNASLLYIILYSTNLSSIPSWMDESFFSKRIVLAGRTPICETINNATSPEGQKLLVERPYLTALMCEDLGFDFVSIYDMSTDLRDDEVW